jgi:hypothetical protein
MSESLDFTYPMDGRFPTGLPTHQHVHLHERALASVSRAVFDAYFMGLPPEELADVVGDVAKVTVLEAFGEEYLTGRKGDARDVQPSIWDAVTPAS